MSYNGWTNYETWNVPLWCDNEEPVYRARMECNQRCTDDWTAETAFEFVHQFWPHGQTPDLSPSDTISINWTEIADNWNEEREDG